MALGPGGAALVPLSEDASLPLIAQASRKIQRNAPAEQRPDLLEFLYGFAEGRYTATRLARVIPERVAMASGVAERFLKWRAIFQVVVGLTEKGRADEAQHICVELTKTLHPAVANRVVPVIERCSELPRLRRWALRAPLLTDGEFVRLVAGGASSRAGRRRAPRPARRSARSTKLSRSVRGRLAGPLRANVRLALP